ncbi:MAG: M3 family oligoendopeptidase, partial [Turicibacter sp.]
MKFEDYHYERPQYEEIKSEFLTLVESLKKSSSAQAAYGVICEINKIRNTLDTMSNIASIRHTIDTTDAFYDTEQEYWDEHAPLYDELKSEFYKAVVNSCYKAELEEKLSKQFFTIADFALKSFSPEIIADLQEENKLCSQYTKLIASAKIMFDGEERNLSGMTPYMSSGDRTVREEAANAKYKFFTEHEDEIDSIYDELVKVRTAIAKKLGFNNFVELGYVRMMRSDYNPEMVENFRAQVLEYIVPVASSLYERQQERLGLDEFTYFDQGFEFASGNPKPKGEPEWIIENGIKMYHELSP